MLLPLLHMFLAGSCTAPAALRNPITPARCPASFLTLSPHAAAVFTPRPPPFARSALEEQVEKHHRRHEALAAQLHELHAKLQAVQQQHQQPANTWQAASFLLFFLLFVNFWALIANFQMGWGLPWMAAKPAGGLWFKQLLSYAVPFTNTAVVLIFCMQAVKAAARLWVDWGPPGA